MLPKCGYAGHEMIPEFNLINMNGRIYDPQLCRFLAPDRFVQAPGNPQSFNRYSYCLNNPLKYVDPSGEFFLGSLFTVHLEFFKTIFTKGGLDPTLIFGTSSQKAEWRDSWSDFDPTKTGTKTNNAIKIDLGSFLHIPGWETKQTILGKSFAHIRNITGNVDNVEIKNGIVLVNDNNPRSTTEWGIIMGPYINSQNMEIDDQMYQHELGHTIQSKILGLLYLLKVGVPSIITVNFGTYHDNCWYETWANNLGGAPQTMDYPREFSYSPFWFFLANALFPFWPN